MRETNKDTYIYKLFQLKWKVVLPALFYGNCRLSLWAPFPCTSMGIYKIAQSCQVFWIIVVFHARNSCDEMDNRELGNLAPLIRFFSYQWSSIIYRLRIERVNEALSSSAVSWFNWFIICLYSILLLWLQRRNRMTFHWARRPTNEQGSKATLV